MMPAPDADAGLLAALGLARIWLRERDGVWCLVDADDAAWLNEWRWNVGWHAKTRWKFYAKRNVGPERSTLYMHREILARAAADYDLAAHGHHLNGQSLDNRRVNLAWTAPEVNSSIRVVRGSAPSLDDIVAQLAAEAGAALPGRELAETF
jgi:hypothetical protein